ncbi:MAG: phosphoribosylaminoimidazolesuccinocarboxamide synthase [Ignavibacteria bacterium]|jgi:phosphoribosylaminoimidazole-succinocarboxamide synthase|nr:phosphoribosylaminoimidazolesuccinocarboxamide synthase [Ignavibacteria bacterium]
MATIFETNFEDIKLFRRGKVRDVYDLDDKLLFVASDRISAFDVIMNEAIPKKGEILTEISQFWFEKTKHILPNHFISSDIADYPEICKKYEAELTKRSMLVEKSKPILLECVVRGYVAGSGWKEYKKQGTICGVQLPAGLLEYQKLSEPIFTPSTKAEVGHDENINFAEACSIVGKEIAEKVRDYSLKLYNFAYEYLYKRGIILADTKFEFGLNNDDEIILIDEALTPDSSRFWLLDDYSVGKAQMNFDKQVLRDYLESTNWNKKAPAPELPVEIIQKTLEKYKFALKAICG